MTVEDIRIKFGFKDHSKRKRLNLSLGLNKSATDYLIDLWIYVAQNHPKGHLNGMDEIDIAMAAGWEGDPEVFALAIGPKPMGCGFLDKDENGYLIHDWEEHQHWVYHSKERSEKARHAALVRHGLQVAPNNDASSINKDASSTGSAMPLSSPFPSSPNTNNTDDKSSGSFSGNHWLNKFSGDLNEMKRLRDELVPYGNANYDAFIQQMLNKNGHPKAIIISFQSVLKIMEDEETLKRMYEESGKKFNAWGYMINVFKNQNPKCNARDAEALHEEIKALKITNYNIKKICEKIG